MNERMREMSYYILKSALIYFLLSGAHLKEEANEAELLVG